MSRFVLIKDGDVVYDSGADPVVVPVPPVVVPPASGDWPPARLPFAFKGPGESAFRSFTAPKDCTLEMGLSCPPGDARVALDGVLLDSLTVSLKAGSHQVAVTSSQGTEGRGTSGSVDFWPS